MEFHYVPSGHVLYCKFIPSRESDITKSIDQTWHDTKIQQGGNENLILLRCTGVLNASHSGFNSTNIFQFVRE